MEKSFRSDRHKELWEKFDKEKQEYLRILGGANEEDARNFSLDDYKETLKKKVPEYTKQDSKNSALAYNQMQGSLAYEKLDYKDKPFYCRVIDNCRNHYLPGKRPFGDPVYEALLDLRRRLPGIHNKVFEGSSDNGITKKEEREFNDCMISEMHLDSRGNFLGEIIHYFNTRGKSKEKYRGNGWGDATTIDGERYGILLDELVNADQDSIKGNEEDFIRAIPMYQHEGFHFWPKE